MAVGFYAYGHATFFTEGVKREPDQGPSVQVSVHTGFDRVFDAILTMARVDKRVYAELRCRSTA